MLHPGRTRYVGLGFSSGKTQSASASRAQSNPEFGKLGPEITGKLTAQLGTVSRQGQSGTVWYGVGHVAPDTVVAIFEKGVGSGMMCLRNFNCQ